MQELQTVLEVNELCFQYAVEPILQNVSFTVGAGDFVALTGSNGTGKSTLLRLLLGELSPTSGTIHIFGKAIQQFRAWTRIGYVPQNSATRAQDFPASVEEIVLSGLYPQIGPLRLPRKTHYQTVQEALKLVNMQAYAKRMLNELSGGQRQRVMLARVLAAECEVMLLDEPTSGVDSASTEALYTLLSQLNREKGLTIIMVTHDLDRAIQYVGRTLCLEECSLMELSLEQVTHELQHKHRHRKE